MIREVIATDAGGLWGWVDVHAPVLSMSISAATLVCLLALAIHALRLSSRVRQLTEDERRNAAILQTLVRQGERHGETLTRLASEQAQSRNLPRLPQTAQASAAPVQTLVSRDENHSETPARVATEPCQPEVVERLPQATPTPVKPENSAAERVRAELEQLRAEITSAGEFPP